ncbi:MAG: GAF domain-containing sensor histidine kinase [bacterium]
MALEEKLLEIANRVNKMINKDEEDKAICSIFLKDIHYGNRFILRANTKGDFGLGTAPFVLTKDDVKKYKEGQLQNIGLTKCAILQKKAIFTDSIMNDKRWSLHGCSEDYIAKREEEHYCEFSYKELGGFIVAPILSSKGNEVIGVVRVVNKKDSVIKYNQQSLNEIENVLKEESPIIDSMSAYSSLIEIGAFLSIRELCSQATIIINNLLGGKGCSIFLLDEERSGPYKKIYRCFGTTGLAYKDENGEVRKIEDPYNDERATYVYEPKKIEGIEKPQLPLTLGVIRARQSAFIDDIDDERDISKQFSEEYKISRAPGAGRVFEYCLGDDRYIRTGSVLFTPLFYRETHIQRIDVLGVIRIGRPKGSNFFNLQEKHLFVWMAEELSRAIINAKYVELLNKLATSRNIRDLYLMVVNGVPKLIGGRDCAILIKNGTKLKKMAEWKEGKERFYEEPEEGYFEYDISDETPSKLGYTGYVAYYKKPLMFNNPEELNSISPKPEHNPKSGPSPERFLGVPILKKEEVFGVIRICKDEDETAFVKNDQFILSQLAERLISEIKRLQGIEEMQMLISAVDHEITPYLNPLFKDIENKRTEDALGITRKIDSIIKRLHDYRTGIEEIKKTSCKITELIEDALKIYKNDMEEKGIKYYIKKPEPEKDVYIDKEKIGIVIRNLISNSVEAINGNGKIDITLNQSNGNLIVTFKDNGCGMREDVKNDLLRKFGSSKPGKMGIGLYLSNRIIKAHQGMLSFESEYGKGASFTIELPYKEREEKDV